MCRPTNVNPLSISSVALLEKEVLRKKNANGPSRRRVSFSHVALREYSRTVGDNPNVNGVPLALDWKYAANDVYSVEHFEELRRSKRKQKVAPLDMTERICLLRRFGISDAQLRQAEKQRKIRLTQEWAYGRDTFGAPKGFSLSTTRTILKQYVV